MMRTEHSVRSYKLCRVHSFNVILVEIEFHRYNPGHALPHKWENAFTLDKSSWGYRRTMTFDSVMTIEVRHRVAGDCIS